MADLIGDQPANSPAAKAAPPGLAWRELRREDLDALVALGRACLARDGGLPFLFDGETLMERYFPDAPGLGIAAWAADGSLAACAAVCRQMGPAGPRVTLPGLVHPDRSGRGIGAYLLDWSVVQAAHLLGGKAGLLQITNEAWNEAAGRLYTARGFGCVMQEYAMAFDLRPALAPVFLPHGVTFDEWRPELAEEFYAAYHAAFRERPGFPGWSAAEWIGQVSADDLVPAWTLLARVEGQPAGFILGEKDLTPAPAGGYIAQVGVVPAQCRRGIASALLLECMRRMQAGGAPGALLAVNLNNPGAIQAYTRLGFTIRGRRARYERGAN